MKKLILLGTFLTLISLFLKAQTPLTQAVNFTATDIYGEDHTLFEYLDDDKIVVIMFALQN